jgi:hypothetical protein
MTAEALIERIKARGGRIFCMETRMVFVLTTDKELRDGLIKLGGRFHSTNAGGGLGGYKRSRDSDKLEWDIWIHTIPVEGETTIYEAAGGKLPPLPTNPLTNDDPHPEEAR